MPVITDIDSLLPTLFQTLTTPLGLKIPTSNPSGLREMIRALRVKTKDPLFGRFEIINSPSNPAGEIWLVLLPEYRTHDEA